MISIVLTAQFDDCETFGKRQTIFKKKSSIHQKEMEAFPYKGKLLFCSS